MIPADLLSALRAKDPELYARFADEDLLEYECSCGYLRTFDASDLIDCAQDAWLLYCIMRAIRARGWFYQIVSKGEWFLGKQISDLGVEAYVGPDPGQDLDTGYADTEAAALLRAYLAALEAKE